MIARHLLWSTCALLLISDLLRADCDPVARLLAVEGLVEFSSAANGVSASNWRPAEATQALCATEQLRVGRYSRATLWIEAEQTTLTLDQHSTLYLRSPPAQERSILTLLRGALHLISRTRRSLSIETPYTNAFIRGTEFTLRVDEGKARTLIAMIEGRAELASSLEVEGGMDRQARVTVSAGEVAVAPSNASPRVDTSLTVADSVRWTLRYQPLLELVLAASGSDRFDRSLDLALAGHIPEAIATFESVISLPIEAWSPRDLAYRAALSLAVGDADHSDALLKPLLSDSDLHQPQYASALAVFAMTHLAEGRHAEARIHVDHALVSNPESAVAWLADSFVSQGEFNLEQATSSAKRAVQFAPESAQAQVRLAELHLANGEWDHAEEVARAAATQRPGLAEPQSTQGFIYLIRHRPEDAEASFRKALELRSALPSAHLGLGLVAMRSGAIREGRRELEVAVALDPGNSLLRSYVGKAYLKEGEERFAAAQYQLAQQLDPNDPTPWLYQAALEQRANRPIKALRSLNASIERNDNRAIYRSKLLLDQDLAVRSSGVAQIYRELGFDQLALVQGWRSLSHDPSEHSAHRLLADVYSALPRHEEARLSELLQAQLLQPANLDPISPRLLQRGFSVPASLLPAEAGLHEYSALFQQEGLNGYLNGAAAGNDTFGAEALISGSHNSLSYSLGQLHFESDGFRENNDQEVDHYVGFAQWGLTPNTRLQIELRHADLDYGDLPLRFSGEFLDGLRQQEEREGARIGLYQRLSPAAEIIASVALTSADSAAADRQGGLDLSSLDGDREDRTAELRYLHNFGSFRLNAGFAITEEEDRTTASTPFSSSLNDREVDHLLLYAYSSWDLFERLTLELGLSWEESEQSYSWELTSHLPPPLPSAKNSGREVVRSEGVSPKLGLTWRPSRDTSVRVALLQTRRRPLINGQTIEPTNVAGFNQFFDSTIGEEMWRYGIGLDHEMDNDLFAGLELSWRERRDIPFLALRMSDPSAPEFVVEETEADEQLHRGYLYWTPRTDLAVAAELIYEETRHQQRLENVESLTTTRLPLTLSYFHSAGWILRAKTTWVNQSGRFTGFSSPDSFKGDERFSLFDLGMSYRLPQGRGMVTAEVNNLFDEEFDFQDTDPRNPSLSPERIVSLRFALAF